MGCCRRGVVGCLTVMKERLIVWEVGVVVRRLKLLSPIEEEVCPNMLVRVR